MEGGKWTVYDMKERVVSFAVCDVKIQEKRARHEPHSECFHNGISLIVYILQIVVYEVNPKNFLFNFWGSIQYKGQDNSQKSKE